MLENQLLSGSDAPNLTPTSRRSNVSSACDSDFQALENRLMSPPHLLSSENEEFEVSKGTQLLRAKGPAIGSAEVSEGSLEESEGENEHAMATIVPRHEAVRGPAEALRWAEGASEPRETSNRTEVMRR